MSVILAKELKQAQEPKPVAIMGPMLMQLLVKTVITFTQMFHTVTTHLNVLTVQYTEKAQ